jgi:hypothetical protein
MAEYGCSPLWEVTDGGVRNVSALELGASAELDERFAAWADRFEATLNEEYPPESGFASPADLEAFEEEGRALGGALQAALGPAIPVEYRSTASVRGT